MVSHAMLWLALGLGRAVAVDDAGIGTNSVSHARTVEALVAEVLSRNPELDFYRAEIAAAKADRRTATQWSNPELSADLGSQRVRERGGPVLGDGVAWSVSVAQEFEYPGRILLRKAIANRQVELAELGLAQFQALLAGRARTRACRALAAQQKADAAQEVAERFWSLLEALVQRDPAGVTPLLDQRIIEATAITIERRATEAERERQEALLELNQLRGAGADTPLRVTGSWAAPTNAPSLAALLNLAATNCFDLRMRQVELAQQGFRVELARNERYPAVTLAPFYSSERASDEQRIVGVGVSLPLPLWNQNQGHIEAARARQQQAEASLRAAQRDIERRVADRAMALEAQIREMGRWRGDALSRFREAAELADRHFRLGSVPVTVYVEMQIKYLDALEALLKGHSEAIEHWEALQALVGAPIGPGTAD